MRAILIPADPAQPIGERDIPPGGVICLDGDALMPGCVCTSGCELPCWQRIGIDDEPCCVGCAPLEGGENENENETGGTD